MNNTESQVNPSGDRQQPARKCSTRLRSRGFGGWCRKLAVALHGEMAPIIGNEASKPASVARPPVGRQHYQNESKRNRFFWCPRQSQSGGALPAAPGGSSEADGVDGLGQAPMIQETSHGCKLLDGLDGLDGPFDAEEKRGQHAGTAQLGALAFEASVSEWNLLESDLYGRRSITPCGRRMRVLAPTLDRVPTEMQKGEAGAAKSAPMLTPCLHAAVDYQLCNSAGGTSI
jgi:hypothetical protein